MKILITGASGFVGRHLLERLIQEGHEVLALLRSPEKTVFPKNEKLKIIKGDLDSPNLDWFEHLPRDLEACIHTAGIVHSFETTEFFRVNTLGTEHLLSNLKLKYNSLHFVLISSLAAAGPSLGDLKRNEEEMDLPVSVYGRSKKRAEEVLKESAPETFTISIIRPPMVIGPRDSAVLDIFKMVKSGLILLPGCDSRKKLYSFVCVFDLVETIVRVLKTSKHALYYSAHPEVVSFEELITQIKKQLNKTWVLYLPMPLFMIKLLARLLRFIYRFIPHSLRLTPDKYYELAATNWTCDAQRTEKELGQVYHYDIEKTVAVTLKDYKSQGWI